jgi:uncharacterized protein YidB (DUF937 family)
MGLMDDVLSMAGKSGGAGEHATALSAIMNYVNSPQVGGIGGLQQQFKEGGLGHVIGSWIGTGQNLPVSADQLQNVLHSGALQAAAQKAGMDPAQLTAAMSSLLPHLVDKLSPNGQVPDGNALQQMLKSFTAGQAS